MEFLLENKNFATVMLVLFAVAFVVSLVTYNKISSEKEDLDKQITALRIEADPDYVEPTEDAAAVVYDWSMTKSKTWAIVGMVVSAIGIFISGYALASGPRY